MSELLSEGAAYKQICELFGSEGLTTDYVEKVDVIPTGSPALDRAIGVGGLPRGRLIHYAGKEGSGKTMNSLIAIANWQKMDPENIAVFLDAEYTFSVEWATMLGVDTDRVILIKSNDAQLLFQGLIGKVSVNKFGKRTKVAGLFDMIKDGQVINAKCGNGEMRKFNMGKVGIIVLDSIAALVCPLEIESTVGKQNFSPVARFLSAELKKLTPGISESNVAFIAINQARTNLQDPYAGDTSPGGRALFHCCSIMVSLAAVNSKESKILNSNNERIAHMIRAKIQKNKVSNPFRECMFTVDFVKGIINTENELLELGVLHEVIQRPNLRTYILGEHKLSSKEDALTFIKYNSNAVEDIIRAKYMKTESTYSFKDLKAVPDGFTRTDSDVDDMEYDEDSLKKEIAELETYDEIQYADTLTI